MSERIIKWGFIGCGEVTKYKSGPAFQKIENSEVVAVMSRNGDKAKTYAKERGIPKWYDDAQELIDDEEVNAVYIATPPSSHATYAIMSMKAGKPVYIEKPMAVTYEECCRINRISTIFNNLISDFRSYFIIRCDTIIFRFTCLFMICNFVFIQFIFVHFFLCCIKIKEERNDNCYN